MPLSFELIRQSLPFLLQGAVYTILLSVGGMALLACSSALCSP